MITTVQWRLERKQIKDMTYYLNLQACVCTLAHESCLREYTVLLIIQPTLTDYIIHLISELIELTFIQEQPTSRHMPVVIEAVCCCFTAMDTQWRL